MSISHCACLKFQQNLSCIINYSKVSQLGKELLFAILEAAVFQQWVRSQYTSHFTGVTESVFVEYFLLLEGCKVYEGSVSVLLRYFKIYLNILCVKFIICRSQETESFPPPSNFWLNSPEKLPAMALLCLNPVLEG